MPALAPVSFPSPGLGELRGEQSGAGPWGTTVSSWGGDCIRGATKPRLHGAGVGLVHPARCWELLRSCSEPCPSWFKFKAAASLHFMGK